MKSKGDNDLDYCAMVPPFEISEFDEMTKKEARQHFDWFISQIPDRIRQLKKLHAWSSESNAAPLDFTPASLVALWEWFIPMVEVEPMSPEQIAEELANLPEWMHEEYLKNPSELTVATHSFITDIGIYFGEVFRMVYPELEWGFVTKPKLLYYVNRPIIMLKGSTFEMDPRHLVYIETLKVLDRESNNEGLLELFEIWKEDL